MPIRLPFVDIRPSQRQHPVRQHCPAIRIDDTRFVSVAQIIGRGDLVQTVVDKEVRPILQPVVVDRRGIVGVECQDAEQQAAAFIVPSFRATFSRTPGWPFPSPASPGSRSRAAHLQQRQPVRSRRRATLHEVADATILHGNEPGGPREIKLLQPPPPQRRRIVRIAEVDPVQVRPVTPRGTNWRIAMTL